MWLMKRRVSLSMMPDWQSQLNIQRAALPLSYILDLGRLQHVQWSNNSNVTWLPRVSEGTVEGFLISSAAQILKKLSLFLSILVSRKKKKEKSMSHLKKNQKNATYPTSAIFQQSCVCSLNPTVRNNWSSALAEYTAALHFSEYVTDGGRETESEGETLHLERRKWERERARGGVRLIPIHVRHNKIIFLICRQ